MGSDELLAVAVLGSTVVAGKEDFAARASPGFDGEEDIVIRLVSTDLLVVLSKTTLRGLAFGDLFPPDTDRLLGLGLIRVLGTLVAVILLLTGWPIIEIVIVIVIGCKS